MTITRLVIDRASWGMNRLKNIDGTMCCLGFLSLLENLPRLRIITMPVDKLIIDRSKWGTGALLNKDGTMCCLGHLSIACGVPADKLLIEGSTHLGFPEPSWVEVNDWARRELLRILTTVHLWIGQRKRSG